MDFKQIQELIRIMGKSNVGEIKIEEKDFKISLKAKDYIDPRYLKSEGIPMPMQMSAMQQPISAPVQTALNENKETPANPITESSKNITIKSPMIGTFYRSSGPGKDPFVKVGDTIQKGNPICVIEAMKLFNEIESEISGKIIKVLVDDSSPVEYDQPLFLVDPS